MVADRVSEPHHVEPADRHALAVMGACQQAFDQPLIGLRRRIVRERPDIFGRRGQADQVGSQTADQGPAVGLGRRLQPDFREPSPHQHVHGVLAGGDLGLDGPLVRPVFLIFRPLLDPAPEDLLLPAGQLLVRLRRRHLLVGVVAEDPFHQLTLPGLSRDDGLGVDRVGTDVKSQVGLATVLVRTVAQEAVVGEDRPYVSIELDLRGLVAAAGRIAAHGHGRDPDDGRDGDW